MKNAVKYIILILIIFPPLYAQSKILINMDISQTNHLKAYGLVFNQIKNGDIADWLLNYKGGSFLLDYSEELALKCQLREIKFEVLNRSEVFETYAFVQNEEENMDVMRLEKTPRIAVYVTPGHKPWDDAVTLALEYAEVEYDKIWIEEILAGKLSDYDWLHLHHEDFTGQYGKFYASFGGASWYKAQQKLYESMSEKTGYSKVSQMELDVVKEIKKYVIKGGFLFAMCSGTDSFDIALAADNVDIVDRMYDGDAAEAKASDKLNFNNTLAFKDFKLEMNPYVYEFSNIDIQLAEIGDESNDYFTLFDFSAKYDPVPTMLTQNHVNVIRGFMGQTTMFRKELIKSSVVILAERKGTNQVRYIHGNLGRGTFTFYGGHDPEDYKHYVGAPPTDLSLHKTSPGYRLILNNILFPAAKKKKQKT